MFKCLHDSNSIVNFAKAFCGIIMLPDLPVMENIIKTTYFLL